MPSSRRRRRSQRSKRPKTGRSRSYSASLTSGVRIAHLRSAPLDPMVRNNHGDHRLGIRVSRSSHEILESAKTIAVVGASRDPNKAGGSVPEGLQRRGFRIIPIHPYADTLVGDGVYRSLLEV